MPLGRNEIIGNPGGSSLPMVSNEVKFWGKVNGQNLCGHQSPRSNFNINCGGPSSYSKNLQVAPRSGKESNSIDFSQSLTQISVSLRHNLNTNPKEEFNVISVCTDTWKETMTVWHNKQQERIHSFEHQLSLKNNAFQESQLSFVKLQEDFKRINDMVARNEAIIPRIR